MLDAYIIERIRREREIQHEQGTLVPLHIDVPQQRPRKEKPERRDDEVGSTIVDYQL
jgi:hypothetical protein